MNTYTSIIIINRGVTFNWMILYYHTQELCKKGIKNSPCVVAHKGRIIEKTYQSFGMISFPQIAVITLFYLYHKEVKIHIKGTQLYYCTVTLCLNVIAIMLCSSAYEFVLLILLFPIQFIISEVFFF